MQRSQDKLTVALPMVIHIIALKTEYYKWEDGREPEIELDLLEFGYQNTNNQVCTKLLVI